MKRLWNWELLIAPITIGALGSFKNSQQVTFIKREPYAESMPAGKEIAKIISMQEVIES